VNPNSITTEADRCVKCGLCLPQCPTYKLTQDEGDSPRGRISLIQAVMTDQIPEPHTRFHLDRCLVCRACETACPSGVRYGFLIDAIRQKSRQGLLTGLANAAVASLPYRRITRSLLNIYLKPPLRRILRWLGGKTVRRLDSLLPNAISTERLVSRTTAPDQPRGRVALFTGCVTGLLERQTLAAAIQVLEHCHYEVIIPENQGCCGAIHGHSGNPDKAHKLGDNNLNAFNSLSVEAIITCASGCGAQLQEYGLHGLDLQHPVMDISEFLLKSADIGANVLGKLDKSVLVHTPCTMKNVMKSEHAVAGLLKKIPGLQLEALALTDCCGSAGSYMLTQPVIADQLREPAIEILRAKRPDILVTSNTGCAMHLRAGIVQASLPIEVCHPVELIARQLKIANSP
jgi:glycolate oxidase iron-sulfur subunit